MNILIVGNNKELCNMFNKHHTVEIFDNKKFDKDTLLFNRLILRSNYPSINSNLNYNVDVCFICDWSLIDDIPFGSKVYLAEYQENIPNNSKHIVFFKQYNNIIAIQKTNNMQIIEDLFYSINPYFRLYVMPIEKLSAYIEIQNAIYNTIKQTIKEHIEYYEYNGVDTSIIMKMLGEQYDIEPVVNTKFEKQKQKYKENIKQLLIEYTLDTKLVDTIYNIMLSDKLINIYNQYLKTGTMDGLLIMRIAYNDLQKLNCVNDCIIDIVQATCVYIDNLKNKCEFKEMII